MFHSFVDCRGNYRRIYGCPLKQRQELSRALSELQRLVLSSRYRSYAALYDKDVEFRAIAHECLALCLVDPDWLDITQLVEFLLPTRGLDGEFLPSLLATLNQLEGEGGDQTYEQAIAEVWHAMGNYEAALRAVGYKEGEPPAWDTLLKIMRARLDILYPQHKAETDAFEQLGKMIESGEFFKGFEGLSPDEVFSGVTDG